MKKHSIKKYFMKKNYLLPFLFSLTGASLSSFVAPLVFAESQQETQMNAAPNFNEMNMTQIIGKINQSERDQRLYQLIQLPNRMKVLLISDPDATKSLGSIGLPVGSLSDPKDQQGLAHYTEHMVLMGSDKYPTPSEFSEFLSQHAGTYNASTSATRTAYFFEVEHNAFEEATDRLADAISAPKLDPINAEKERNAVNAELTMARANDAHRLAQVDGETVNQNHPTSQFYGGNLETLSDKPTSKLQDALESFYQANYSANNMVGILYSPKSLSDMAQIADKTFGRIKDNDRTLPIIKEQALPKETLSKWITAVPAQAKKMLWVQFPIENNLAQFNEKSDEYLAYLINSRSEGTLFNTLQEADLIESVYAGTQPNRYGNSGQFTVYFTLTDKGLAHQTEIVAALFSYLELIKKQGVDERYYAEMQKVLNLGFNYPDISRDMRYVEMLSDQMMIYPNEHILDADYVADHFNRQAIEHRIDELTLKNSRIWTIAPDQKTDKVAYFVETPYSIRDLTPKELQTISADSAKWHFKLPELNPYLADDLSILKQVQTNQTQAFNPKGNLFHFVSTTFQDEPKAAIALTLRSQDSLSTAQKQVAFSFLNYLLNRDLAQLRFQAAVAGIDLATNPNDGLMITAEGFNQHLPEMVLTVLDRYQNLTINDDLLALAKSNYLQQLEASDNVQSFKLALEPISALGKTNYFSKADRKAIANTIKTQDLIEYKQSLLKNSVPYLLTLGNLTEQQAQTLLEKTQQALAFDPNQSAISYQKQAPLWIDEAQKVLLTKQTETTDNALYVGFMPLQNHDETDAMSGYLLYKMVSSGFYDKLRSKEQLGYVVAAVPMQIQKNYGIGFIVQSNEADAPFLKERFEAFYPTAREKIAQLSDEEFDRYKQGLLSELLQSPQTISEEMTRYLNDFSQNEFDFATRQKKIDALKSLTKEQILAFYDKAITTQSGLVIYSQVIGSQEGATAIKDPELTSYLDASLFQEALKVADKHQEK